MKGAPGRQLDALLCRVQTQTGLNLQDPGLFHEWSCEHPDVFWEAALREFGLPFDGELRPAMTGSGVRDSRFFPHLRLNAAQWLLWPRDEHEEHAEAVVIRDETGARQACSRGQLRERAMRVAAGLTAAGLGPQARAVAIGRNSLALVTAFLGSAAVGATWSAVGTDLGGPAVLARFGQLSPSVAFVDEEHRHHGRAESLLPRLHGIVRELPSLRLVVRLNPGPEAPSFGVPTVTMDELLAFAPVDFATLDRHPFDHPLLILFTSGTTGRPKCLVHGAGGTLLEHLKEHRLHGDYGPDQKLLFVTSCGWMMWNWAVSALASAMPLVLYDGSVTFPDADRLPRILGEERVTVFGASPAYFQVLEQLGKRPADAFDLGSLHTVLSTGSVLHERQYDWLDEAFDGARVESISGGTDIVGCFVLGHPHRPPVRGDSTGPGLAMRLAVAGEDGIVAHGEGDLVCKTPFPSRPVAIWGDTDGSRLDDSYYRENPGVWTHGDRALIRSGGSVRILGRSDGVLNVRGVRIGPAEVQAVATTVEGVAEAMAAGEPDPDDPGGQRLVLLVTLVHGAVLDRPMTLRIKRAIRDATSPLHVPARIQAISALPVTHSGKQAEGAVRAVLAGRPVASREALRNPEVLNEISSPVRGSDER